MYMTKNFTLAELTKTSTGIKNDPPAAAILWLKILAVAILQPLRDKVGHGIIINSGYRCPAVNARVGGAATSAHLYGRAADIRCTQPEGWEYIEILKTNPHVDKVLFEHNNKTGAYWLHVQTSENPRHIFPKSIYQTQ
jgi:hypothetical protein